MLAWPRRWTQPSRLGSGSENPRPAPLPCPPRGAPAASGTSRPCGRPGRLQVSTALVPATPPSAPGLPSPARLLAWPLQDAEPGPLPHPQMSVAPPECDHQLTSRHCQLSPGAKRPQLSSGLRSPAVLVTAQTPSAAWAVSSTALGQPGSLQPGSSWSRAVPTLSKGSAREEGRRGRERERRGKEGSPPGLGAGAARLTLTGQGAPLG